FSLPPRFLLTFLAPYILGGGNGLLYRAPYIDGPFFGEYAAYAGLITLMLAGTGLVLKRDVRSKFWGIVVIVALFLGIGRFMPFGLYEIFYQVPLLNLYRSSSRHLMEVHFALAVLAGRGLTAVRSSRKSVLFPATTVAGSVLLLTLLAVTWWRPGEFRLDREVPVSLLRAPELFVPVFIATLSAVAFWIFARAKTGRALVALFIVLALDLFLYGQGSAWRTHSPGPQHELWQEPEAVKVLPSRDASAYRIFTADQPFDPNSPVSVPADTGSGPLTLQPDIYMMHGFENAAGYDGFGLARYSRLAGDMKVWGELTDGEGTLRGDSRALDLLNVRYLLARRTTAAAVATTTFPAATAGYGGQSFAAGDLGLPPTRSGSRISFTVPPTEVDRLALLTNLAWSDDVPDHTPVAQIELRAQDGKTFSFDLRAGDHTSEWAYDRADIRARIKHKRAPVATSYAVEDPRAKYEAHTYVSVFSLPARAVVVSGTINVAAIKNAPDLSLTVTRITLAKDQQALPLPREWINEETGKQSAGAANNPSSSRWKRIAEVKDVAVFENARALPRVWLANEAKVLPGTAILVVIRTGKLPDGKPWDPQRVALIEGAFDFPVAPPDEKAISEITSYEPNRVAVKTKSSEPAILVLSENHYPGWRAYVDGRLVDTLRVDYNLRGVALPAGEHNVEFVYRPKSVLIGAGISLLTLMGMIFWWKRWLPEERVLGLLTAKLPKSRA
ncbi:MAG TPA: YfhO family protein, partial [Pyrinomonadaceae bacterium]|nr:YfhO family protein [Pyrinomonadaceae bacterium]